MVEDRHIAIELIDEAVAAGARRFKACAVLEIDLRTLQRWKKALAEQRGLEDQRKAAGGLRNPANKLRQQERDTILDVCKQPEYKSLPPSKSYHGWQMAVIISPQSRVSIGSCERLTSCTGADVVIHPAPCPNRKASWPPSRTKSGVGTLLIWPLRFMAAFFGSI